MRLLAVGAVLLVLAAIGVALVAGGEPRRGRAFSADGAQTAIHAALALAALAGAFAPRARLAGVAGGLAVVLLGLAIVGTLSPRLFGYPERLGSELRWEVGENAAHLLLGGWCAYVAANARND